MLSGLCNKLLACARADPLDGLQLLTQLSDLTPTSLNPSYDISNKLVDFRPIFSFRIPTFHYFIKFLFS